MSSQPTQQIERVYVEPQIARDLAAMAERFRYDGDVLTHNIIEAARVAIVDLTIRCEDRGASFKEMRASRDDLQRRLVEAHAELVAERAARADAMNRMQDMATKLAIATHLPGCVQHDDARGECDTPLAAAEGRTYNKTAIEVAAEVLLKAGAQFSAEKVLELLAYTRRLEEKNQSYEVQAPDILADLWRIKAERDQLRAQLAESKSLYRDTLGKLQAARNTRDGLRKERDALVRDYEQLCAQLAATKAAAEDVLHYRNFIHLPVEHKAFDACDRLRRTLDTTDAKEPK